MLPWRPKSESVRALFFQQREIGEKRGELVALNGYTKRNKEVYRIYKEQKKRLTDSKEVYQEIKLNTNLNTFSSGHSSAFFFSVLNHTDSYSTARLSFPIFYISHGC